MSSSNPSLTRLAEQINREHDAALRCSRASVEHAVRAGRLLLEAKRLVAHGGWLPWVDEHFRGSRRTMQNYKRLAEHEEDAHRLAHLGIAGALSELARPSEHGDGDAFAIVPNELPAEHCCPRCAYRWSGETGAAA